MIPERDFKAYNALQVRPYRTDREPPPAAPIWASVQTILLSNQLQSLALSLPNGVPICPVHTSIYRKSHKINMPNKFSFGPSQEDEGQKKTVHSTQGSCLYPHHVCSIDPVPARRCQSKAHLLIIRKSRNRLGWQFSVASSAGSSKAMPPRNDWRGLCYRRADAERVVLA